jgi:peptidoglycan/xylan/chitin deacetylase (PgdA/CDA1 family)
LNLFGRSKIGKTPIIAYHKVGIKFDWSGTWATLSQFDLQMRYLHSMGYTTCTLDEATKGYAPGKVALTFDDAYESVYSGAFAVMRRYGFRGTVFVITGYAGRVNVWDVNLGHRRWNHMRWDQMREMRDHGFEFGSHTHVHPDLTAIPSDAVERELEVSRGLLEQKLGIECRYLSYPFGRTNVRVKEAARKAGYEAAFSITPRADDDAMEIGRLGVYVIDLLFDFKAKLGHYGQVMSMLEGTKGRVINFFSRGTTLIKSPSRAHGGKV